MSTLEEFLKAEKRLRERQEASVERQRRWDKPKPHVEITNRTALGIAGASLLGAALLWLFCWLRAL